MLQDILSDIAKAVDRFNVNTNDSFLKVPRSNSLSAAQIDDNLGFFRGLLKEFSNDMVDGLHT